MKSVFVFIHRRSRNHFSIMGLKIAMTHRIERKGKKRHTVERIEWKMRDEWKHKGNGGKGTKRAENDGQFDPLEPSSCVQANIRN